MVPVILLGSSLFLKQVGEQPELQNIAVLGSVRTEKRNRL
jgi:hypothetical protein